MLNKRKSIIAGVISLCVLTVGGRVWAEQNNTYEEREQRQDAREMRIEERQQIREEAKDKFMAGKCEIRTRRLENKIKWLDMMAENHRNRYQRAADRITNLLSRLDEKGADTTQLKADLEVLKTKLQVLKDNYDKLVAKIEEDKALPCDTKLPIDELQTLRENVRTAAEDVRVYFRDTIKKDLEQIRTQLETSTTESSN